MQTIACHSILIFNRSCFTSFRHEYPYSDQNWQNGVCVHANLIEAEKDRILDFQSTVATISASEQLIIVCGWNKFYSVSFDVNSGQAIGKDAIECLSLQLLTSSLLETPCSRKNNHLAPELQCFLIGQ